MNATTDGESSAPLEAAKKKILGTIADFEKARRDELLEAVNTALSYQKPESGPEGRRQEPKNRLAALKTKILAAIRRCLFGRIGFVLIILVQVGAAAYFAAYHRPSSAAAEMPDLKVLLAYLAFVVALSSYLASVARETVKRLSAGGAEDPERLREHLFLMATAEIPLVAAGVAAVLRLFVGPRTAAIPYTTRCLSFDAFLVSLLAVVLLWLAILHLRVWCITKPWKVER